MKVDTKNKGRKRDTKMGAKSLEKNAWNKSVTD